MIYELGVYEERYTFFCWWDYWAIPEKNLNKGWGRGGGGQSSKKKFNF